MTVKPLREWLVIEDSRTRGVFMPKEQLRPQGYIPRDVAEALLGRRLDANQWFTSEESALMRMHPAWRYTEPPGDEPTELNDVLEIVEKVKPFFAGKDPAIQGAALAELTSLWLAGHEKEARDELMQLQNETVKELTEVARKMMGDFGDRMRAKGFAEAPALPTSNSNAAPQDRPRSAPTPSDGESVHPAVAAPLATMPEPIHDHTSGYAYCPYCNPVIGK